MPADPHDEHRPAPWTPERIADALVCWIPMSGPAHRFGLGWGLELDQGYDPVFDQIIFPLSDLGVRHYGIWMPYSLGTIDVPGQHLNFEALSDLSELGLAHLVADLPIHLRRHARTHPTATHLLYHGSLLEPDLTRLLTSRRLRAWIDRVMATIRPTLDIPSVRYGADAWSPREIGTPANEFWEFIASLISPRPIYTEGWPLRNRPDTHSRPVCVTNTHYLNSRPLDEAYGPVTDRLARNSWALPSQSLHTEVIRIDQNPTRDPDTTLHTIASILSHPSGLHRWAGPLFGLLGPSRPFPDLPALTTALLPLLP